MRSQHLLRINPQIKLFFSDYIKLNRTLLKREIILMRIFSNSSSLIISNIRIECCNKHKTLIQQLLNLNRIRLYPDHTIQPETITSITQQLNTVQYIPNNQRLKHIQLKMPIASSNSHSSLIPHHLSTHHCHCLTLGRVHFPWHYR